MCVRNDELFGVYYMTFRYVMFSVRFSEGKGFFLYAKMVYDILFKVFFFFDFIFIFFGDVMHT